MNARRRWLPELFFARSLAWLDRHLSQLSGERMRIVFYRLVAQPVAEAPLLPAGRGRKIQVRELSAEEAESLDFPRPRRVIRQRFADGGQCLAAFKDERMIGFLWLQRDAYQEDEVRCLFLPRPAGRAAWDYDVYVDPDYRFSAAFARLWDEAFGRLRREAITWTMSRVAATNAGSLASHSRLRARVVGSVIFLRLGPVQITCSTCPPYVHLAPGRRSRPRLAVHPD